MGAAKICFLIFFFFLLSLAVIGPIFPAAPASGLPLIQIVDASGQTVKLAKVPQRILVLGRSPYVVLHLLYMFPEGKERLLGSEKKGKLASDFLPLVDPGFKDKIFLESDPGPEEIAAQQPDLVLVKGMGVGLRRESLAKVGIPIVYLGFETPEQFFKDVSNLGIILGNERRAKEIRSFFKSRIERVQKAVSTLRENENPRVLLIMATDRGGKVGMQVPATDWMQTIQVRSAGGTPVWLEVAQRTSGWTIVNLEQIALWDPDQIYVVIWHTLEPQQVIDALRKDSRWSALKAVRSNALYVFPSDIYGWDTPDPRWILGMTWLAARIHPALFKTLDMSEEVYRYFGELYGLDRKAVDTGLRPHLKIDIN